MTDLRYDSGLLQLFTALCALPAQLERLEALLTSGSAQPNTRPQLLRAKDAIALFGGTKEQFYALVRRGEIDVIRYEEHADPLYDTANIAAVIERYRLRAGSKARAPDRRLRSVRASASSASR